MDPLSIEEFGRRLRSNRLSSADAVETCLHRIESDNARLNAFVLVMADEARRPGASRGMAHLLADRAIDSIRDRFGWESVGYASVALGARRAVPRAPGCARR